MTLALDIWRQEMGFSIVLILANNITQQFTNRVLTYAIAFAYHTLTYALIVHRANIVNM